MNRLLIMIGLIGIAFGSIIAQSPISQPTPSAEQQARERMEKNKRTDGEFERLKNVGNNTVVRKPYLIIPPNLKLTKEQSARLAPDKEDLAKYKDFLKLPKTGLIRLFPDIGCWEKGVVRVDELCQNSIPVSSYYSFRKDKYSGKTLGDIGLKDSNFIAGGWKSQGIIVLLGDIPIENISIDNDGLKFLVNYKPAIDIQAALIQSQNLMNGTKSGNYNYSDKAVVSEEKTYAVRAIAYRGKSLNTFDRFVIDSDKRVDTIVVFRVVRKDKDGSITLLWKELKRIDSPKI